MQSCIRLHTVTYGYTRVAGFTVQSCIRLQTVTYGYTRVAGFTVQLDLSSSFTVQSCIRLQTVTYGYTRVAGFTVQLDLSSSFNCLSSRGALQSYDVLPPGHAQLLHALSLVSEGDGSRMAYETQFRSDVTSPEVHSPEVRGLHRPQPLERRERENRAAVPVSQLMQMLGMRFIG